MLQRLGVAKAFDAAGTAIRQYETRDGHGRLLRQFPLGQFEERFGCGYVQVERKRLHGMLCGCAEASRLRMGRGFVGLQQRDDGVVVRWEDTSGAAAEDRFDLVVGADGVSSAVRAAAFGAGLERYTGWRSWYGWVEQSLVPRGAMVEFLAAGRCAALFDDAHGERALGVFFAAQEPGMAAESPRQVRTLFAQTVPGLAAVLESAGDTVRLGADLATVQLRRWASGRVVLLGDAAHAFEPHNGLGASMAMEDAAVLAEELANIGENRNQIDGALAAYERRRRGRVTMAQRISERIRLFAFVRGAMRRRLADRGIRILPRGVVERDYFRLFEGGV